MKIFNVLILAFCLFTIGVNSMAPQEKKSKKKPTNSFKLDLKGQDVMNNMPLNPHQDYSMGGSMNNKEKKNKKKKEAEILGLTAQQLGGIAPIAIVMYCYNEHPKFTMIALSSLLLMILMHSDSAKKKVAILRSRLAHCWYDFKSKALYVWSRTRL